MPRKKTLLSLGGPVVGLLGALSLSACGGGGTSTAAQAPVYGGGAGATSQHAAPAASAGSAAVRVSKTSLGMILVSPQGRTLYLFKADKGTHSSCSGACASAWPPLRVTGTPVGATGIDKSKLGTTSRSDGKPQVTYNGHPLYTYVGDTKPGDVTGQGLTQFGAAWFAVSPAGRQVSGRP